MAKWLVRNPESKDDPLATYAVFQGSRPQPIGHTWLSPDEGYHVLAIIEPIWVEALLPKRCRLEPGGGPVELEE